MLALGARGTGFNSRVPDLIDFKIEPIHNRFIPILDINKRREYQRLYHLKTWDKRKIRHKLLKQIREQELSKWLSEYKKSMFCEVCGESYSRCLDFHHDNGEDKINNVSDLTAKGYGKATIIKEIKKCRVLCKNCHVKIHDKQMKSIG